MGNCMFLPEHRQPIYYAYYQYVKELFGLDGATDWRKNRRSTSQTYKKLSVLLRSTPRISLFNHFSSLLLKIIMLSVVKSIIWLAKCFNSLSLTSVISPSKTEFCIQWRYFRQSLSILPTRFSPTSYTKITYITIVFNSYQYFVKCFLIASLRKATFGS